MPRILKDAEQMSVEIQGFDFHTYWRDTNAKEKQLSFEFADKVAQNFALEIEQGRLLIKRHWTTPVGPHPIHMWELDTVGEYDAGLFARVLAFYQLNHGKLSVLIHPHTSAGSVKDHTDHALWLGHKQDLIIDVLRNLDS